MTHLVLSCKFNCVSEWCAEDGNGIVRFGICFFIYFCQDWLRELFIFNFCAYTLSLELPNILYILVIIKEP